MSARLSLQELVLATRGHLISGPVSAFEGVGTDTRQDLTGRLFVALKGDRFDAHDFLDQAVAAGAAALLVHREVPALDALKTRVSVVRVDDTLAALQNLGRFWRRRLSAQIVGISGSNGKTTTKEFTAAVSSSRWKTAFSPGSFNNHWGVPISLLNVSLEDEVAILEMGMNHAGELTELAGIAEPDIVVITMVGQSHIGHLGSQQAIANAKEELYLARPAAVQIFNIDNEFTIQMHLRAVAARSASRIFTYSAFRPEADINMRIERMNLDGVEVSGRVLGQTGVARVPVFGRHNVSNLMAAAAINVALGMSPKDVWAALPRCKTNWGRNQVVKLGSGALALFDAYNANPESMAALVKNVMELSPRGRKIMVLGEMLELGDRSEALHRELGQLVGASDIDMVWFVGTKTAAFKAGLESSGFSKTSYFSDAYEQTLAKQLGSMLHPDDIVVIKGSRGIRLERVLEALDPLDFKIKK